MVFSDGGVVVFIQQLKTSRIYEFSDKVKVFVFCKDKKVYTIAIIQCTLYTCLSSVSSSIRIYLISFLQSFKLMHSGAF